jgi:hypothetical protein
VPLRVAWDPTTAAPGHPRSSQPALHDSASGAMFVLLPPPAYPLRTAHQRQPGICEADLSISYAQPPPRSSARTALWDGAAGRRTRNSHCGELRSGGSPDYENVRAELRLRLDGTVRNRRVGRNATGPVWTSASTVRSFVMAGSYGNDSFSHNQPTFLNPGRKQTRSVTGDSAVLNVGGAQPADVRCTRHSGRSRCRFPRCLAGRNCRERWDYPSRIRASRTSTTYLHPAPRSSRCRCRCGLSHRRRHLRCHKPERHSRRRSLR